MRLQLNHLQKYGSAIRSRVQWYYLSETLGLSALCKLPQEEFAEQIASPSDRIQVRHGAAGDEVLCILKHNIQYQVDPMTWIYRLSSF